MRSTSRFFQTDRPAGNYVMITILIFKPLLLYPHSDSMLKSLGIARPDMPSLHTKQPAVSQAYSTRIVCLHIK